MAITDEATEFVGVVEDLREAIAGLDLPLRTAGQPEGLRVRQGLLQQLDDYVLPRLRALDAPLLAVVGGSTGAGKSTLVNSIVGSPVSRSGVLRPTTTTPVLVHHPIDTHWFTDQRILPGLARRTGSDSADQPGTVRLAASETLLPGVAILDAPDIDSVVRANRELAGQLLNAADLWLFVTTAARYADAVPWDLLRTASDRGTAVAIVLDRIPSEAIDEIRPHLMDMLREHGLGTAPIFTIPESPLSPAGLLPPDVFARLAAWLQALSQDSRARAIVVSQTLKGAISSLDERTASLIKAAREQTVAADALLAAPLEEFDLALGRVEQGMADGSLLRGEVLARWQEFVGTGEFFKTVESTVGRWRDRVVAAVKGAPPPSKDLGEALQTGVAALVRAHGEAAILGTAREWRRLPGGEHLLEAQPSLKLAGAAFPTEVEELVRRWQSDIFDLVRTEGGNRRTNARVAAYGVNAVGLVLMLVTFSATGALTGAEAGIAGGTAVLAQRVLEAIFGDQAVRSMAAKARQLLLSRTAELYAAQRHPFDQAVPSLTAVRNAAAAVERAADAVDKATS
ncbi:MAG: ABC transporter [Phycicoccus sp.]|nr:ABC transporter [Phycicoccus sp.]